MFIFAFFSVKYTAKTVSIERGYDNLKLDVENDRSFCFDLIEKQLIKMLSKVMTHRCFLQTVKSLEFQVNLRR